MYYKAQIYQRDDADLPPQLVSEVNPPYLEADQSAAMERVVNRLKEETSGAIEFTASLLQLLLREQLDQDAAFLLAGDMLQKQKLSESRARVVLILDALATAGIPAQRIRGVFLEIRANTAS